MKNITSEDLGKLVLHDGVPYVVISYSDKTTITLQPYGNGDKNSWISCTTDSPIAHKLKRLVPETD